ncbi:MAG: 4Fe-4S binding protein, partial [Clostridiales bacterium]|nr:4Fe-4S binding protein [Clostridiales bacterium]
MDTFFHSVHLESDLCKGCINCIKRCPTEAIRVRNGKAHIIKEFCIDCGECIRICPHHAKKATFDSFDILHKYKHTVALPAPSLYGQFNNLEDINIVLKGLIDIGFDDVYEVSAAAEMISELTRDYIKNHEHKLPVINSACPSVVRLIRVRFPNLIDLLLPLKTPMDLAASLARKRAVENTGLRSNEIGIIFISPCPAKVTSVYSPLGSEKSEVDAVIGMSEVYPRLVQVMKRTDDSGDSEEDNYVMSGKIGITWGESGGEAAGVLSDSYLAADGIENVIRVLEDIEDQKLPNLEFIELNACSGGCVGGVLAVENPYIAKAKIHKLRRY